MTPGKNRVKEGVTMRPQAEREQQSSQSDLLREAERLPGVAEAAAVYERLTPYVRIQTPSRQVVQSFATGGNE